MEPIRTEQVEGHTVEVYELEPGQRRSGRPKRRFVGKVDGVWNWTEHLTEHAALRALTAQVTDPQPQPAHTPGNVTGTTGWSKYSRGSSGQAAIHRTMFELTGLESAAYARGDCHYCGQRLNRRGDCDECQ